MPIGNVQVVDQEVQGLWALLKLIASPQAEESRAFLTELIRVRDETKELAQQAATDKLEAQNLSASLKAREEAVTKTRKELDAITEKNKELRQSLEAKHEAVAKILRG
jgi:hypothetical protein